MDLQYIVKVNRRFYTIVLEWNSEVVYHYHGIAYGLDKRSATEYKTLAQAKRSLIARASHR